MGAVDGLSGGPLSVFRDGPLTARTEGHSCIMPERPSGGKGVVRLVRRAREALSSCELSASA